MRQTVLVTGIHRSGSTWVGQVLNHLPHTYYIPELFNPDNVSGFLREPFERNYEYVCADNEQDYIQRITDALDFRYPLGSNWHKAASAGEKTQVLKRYAANAVRRQMSRPNIILKDPTAFFSSEWLHQRFNAKVVLLIRHPAAFTSSVKRLGWRISCKPLLDQRLLVRDYLGPFEEEIRNEPKDYVGRCALFWKVVYSVAHQFQKKWPGWMYVRHEDISAEPQTRFEEICKFLDVPVSRQMQDFISKTTSSKNPSQAGERVVHNLSLHSKEAARNWQKSLTADDIKRIREGVGDASYLYYMDEDFG
jgi:hypothetical protein